MKQVILYLIFLFLIVSPLSTYSQAQDSPETHIADEKTSSDNDHQTAELHNDEHSSEHPAPPVWTVIPFILLLLMIATGPLFYEHFWHHHYPKIAVALAVLVVLYYILALQ